MAERYTRRDAEAAFARLLLACRKREATSCKDVGGWTLDHNGIYGGYVVQEIHNENGAITQPFGYQRRTAREFCDAVNFATHAVSIREFWNRKNGVDMSYGREG
jgi:hypothetical protein